MTDSRRSNDLRMDNTRNAIRAFGSLLLALSISGLATSDESFIDRIAGYYAASSGYCSEFDGQGLKACDFIADCLILERLDAHHAKLNIHSIQINLNSCSVAGVAELRGNNTLTYTERNPANLLSYGKGFFVVIADGYLRFKYHSEPALGAQPPFCGQQARIDRLQFRLRDREQIGNRSCGDDR